MLLADTDFPTRRVIVANSGEELTLGPFGVTLIESHHCPPDRFPGAITEPVMPPAKASAYRCGEAWSTLIHHTPSDRRLLIQGSAGFRPDALAGRRAEVAYLGVGQLGVQPEDYIVEYWEQTARAGGCSPGGADPLGRFLPPADRADAGVAVRR